MTDLLIDIEELIGMTERSAVRKIENARMRYFYIHLDNVQASCQLFFWTFLFYAFVCAKGFSFVGR